MNTWTELHSRQDRELIKPQKLRANIVSYDNDIEHHSSSRKLLSLTVLILLPKGSKTNQTSIKQDLLVKIKKSQVSM